MPVRFMKVFFLFVLFTFICSGCTHYAPFPELEGQDGSLASDKLSSQENSFKRVEQKNEVAQAKNKDSKTTAQKPIIKEEKAKEVSRDLSKPNPEVEDIVPYDTSYNITGKSTPSVLTDIDLTEMDAEDGKIKIIQPISETKTVLATKTVQRELPKKIIKKRTSSRVFYLAETVYFNNGSAAVDSKYWGTLRKIVKEAKAHNGTIIVQGFASSRTRNTDMMSHKLANLRVSVKRADNVADVLVKYGMPRSHIITEGLSDSRPAYQEVMPEGERLNRRAEIYVRY